MSPIASRIRTLPFVPLPEPSDLPVDGRPVRRMHLNESPFPPADEVIAAMAAAAAHANRYPDGEALRLVEALGRETGATPERIFVGSGSNELLAASAEIAAEPGTQIVAPEPGFPAYRKLAHQRGADFVGVPLRDDGSIDVEALIAAVTDRTRLVFVSSPHNPTGAVMSGTEVARLATGLPDRVMLHFDEAYFEFGRAAGAPDALSILTARRGPWLSTRTFSKAHGLAGARVGYGIAADAEIATAIRKVRPNFSLNAMALAGACAALACPQHSERLVSRTLAERERLVAALQPLGFQALEGAANFAALRPPRPAAELAECCTRSGILVNALVWGGENGVLRVTIGSREDNDAFAAAMRACCERPDARPADRDRRAGRAAP